MAIKTERIHSAISKWRESSVFSQGLAIVFVLNEGFGGVSAGKSEALGLDRR